MKAKRRDAEASVTLPQKTGHGTLSEDAQEMPPRLNWTYNAEKCVNLCII